MISAMVEVTLTNFHDLVRHFWKLDLGAVDYKSEEDIRAIFNKYLGLEFKFKREGTKNTDLGLKAALKDIWSKTTAEVALNVDPVKVTAKEESEPKKVETRKKRKISINQDNQEIKTKRLYNVNSEAIEFRDSYSFNHLLIDLTNSSSIISVEALNKICSVQILLASIKNEPISEVIRSFELPAQNSVR